MTRFAGSRKGVHDFLGVKTDFAGLGNTATRDAAETVANTALNNARSADALMSSEAKVAAANHWADATKAAGQAQGQASLVSGIASGIGGLNLGGLGGGGGGGGSSLSGMNLSYSSGLGSFSGSGFNSGPWSKFG